MATLDPTQFGLVPDTEPQPTGKLDPAQFGLRPAKGFFEEAPSLIAPALGKGVVAAATGWPTMLGIGADLTGYAADNLFPENETAKKVSSGAKALSDKVHPVTYGGVMESVEKGVPSIGWQGTGKLPEAESRLGKFFQTGLEWAPSIALPQSGGLGARALRVGAGALSSETAGQLADAYLPEKYAPYVRALGGVLGAAFGPAGARKFITPNPAKPQSAADAALLKKADPDIKLSAGSETGSTKALQKESNLAEEAMRKRDDEEFTKLIGGQAGLPKQSNYIDKDFATRGQQFANSEKIFHGFGVGQKDLNTLKADLANVRTTAAKELKTDRRMKDIDKLIEEINTGGVKYGTSKALGFGHYKSIRDDLNIALRDAGPTEATHLRNMRDVLDKAMEGSVPGLKAYRDQKNLYDALLHAEKGGQITPESFAKALQQQHGEKAFKESKVVGADLTHAASRAFTRPEAKSGRLAELTAKLAGGVGGYAGGKLAGSTDPAVQGIFGRDLVGDLQSLVRGITKPVYFSKANQARLKNQWWLPDPGSQPQLVEAIKALSRRGQNVPSITRAQPESE